MKDSKPVDSPSHGIPKLLFEPLWNNVAMFYYPQTESLGGIYMPDTMQKPGRGAETNRCLVLGVGPDCKIVKPGDEVLILDAMPGIVYRGVGIAFVGENFVNAIVNEPCEATLQWRKENLGRDAKSLPQVQGRD